MKIFTKEILIQKHEIDLGGASDIQRYYESHLRHVLPNPHKALRFVITKTDDEGYHCELDVMVPDVGEAHSVFARGGSIFDFRKRSFEKTDKFTAALLIPTGIGAELGGHCGDGNAVARLVASASDTLLTHPNVVNASDINEMKDNTQYVEGSVLTRVFMGQAGLQPVRSNRILMLMDTHNERFFNDEVINAVSSARVTLGIDCDVHEMIDKTESISRYSASGRAVGEINAMEKIFEPIERYRQDYDAVALSTFLKVPEDSHSKYFHDDDMVNPWGGIEAMLTHSIAETFNMPCAHSPMMTSSAVNELQLGVVDPRKAPESASVTYLHCILKGLHRAPRVVSFEHGITLEDLSCMIIPDGCVGLPTLAALENNIPVIAVRENANTMRNDLRDLPFREGKLFIVDNYLEAVGIMHALKAGLSPHAVRRPIHHTKVLSSANSSMEMTQEFRQVSAREPDLLTY